MLFRSLKSVGIDIGSSTSHLIFSHITLRREGASLSGKFKVTNREVLYRSPIMLTPYISATKIDTDKVNDFIHAAYKEAGLGYLRMDDSEIVERIASNPALLRLPLVRFDTEVAAGRDQATWKRWVTRRDP